METTNLFSGTASNGLLSGKITDSTSEFQYPYGLFGCFFRDSAFAKRMRFRIYPVLASVTADRPVCILIVFGLSRCSNTVTAIDAVMVFPFHAFGTDTVTTSESFCLFITAISAQFTVRTYFPTVIAFLPAFLTDKRTFRASVSAETDCFHAVLAQIALGTEVTCPAAAVHAPPAILTERSCVAA